MFLSKKFVSRFRSFAKSRYFCPVEMCRPFCELWPELETIYLIKTGLQVRLRKLDFKGQRKERSKMLNITLPCLPMH